MQLNLLQDEISLPLKGNFTANKLLQEDRAFHDWYRFVLSFPPHLVKDYLTRFRMTKNDLVWDPFCGTGTTALESKILGIPSVGFEANPMAYLASKTKVSWNLDPESMINVATLIYKKATELDKKISIEEAYRLNEEQQRLIIKDSIEKNPLSQALLLVDLIKGGDYGKFENHLLLALAKIIVFSISNLHFGPEVGVRKNKRTNFPVYSLWLQQVKTIANDLSSQKRNSTKSTIFNLDSRGVPDCLEKESVTAVFTSPPYPNEKDYTRTTRLESVILGLIKTKEELRKLKGNLLRSNTRNVYKADTDEQYIKNHPKILELTRVIDKKRIELGKTSGFEKLYGRVVSLYFGGMARHFEQMRPYLAPGAKLGYVVGDQASYFQVMIRTGELLGDVAKELGYKVSGIDLFRTRIATATKMQMREEVLVLEWPG